ncbi:hypothetical protein GCK72_010405 [Caenorhabditis remanei]|uniref:Uncharacterized protein n=1 Tax=Caenorhabditis remanei TaxID=31234 RepID=A0A6A5H6J1_CAERE|nr:hypothetical protein GCK72_010405 [Caenorhabditis remanei]KAF1762143.1 hypothetical protein GCK72_010405 [Caenorhabditis remanei]
MLRKQTRSIVDSLTASRHIILRRLCQEDKPHTLGRETVQYKSTDQDKQHQTSLIKETDTAVESQADEEQLQSDSAGRKISTPTAPTSHLKLQHRMCLVATSLAEGRSRTILQHRQAVYVLNSCRTLKTSRVARRQAKSNLLLAYWRFGLMMTPSEKG